MYSRYLVVGKLFSSGTNQEAEANEEGATHFGGTSLQKCRYFLEYDSRYV